MVVNALANGSSSVNANSISGTRETPRAEDGRCS